MALAMADETARETLLIRVKEQGEIVRRLKAAKTDNTQVSCICFFLFREKLICFIPLQIYFSLFFISGFVSRSIVISNHIPFTSFHKIQMKVYSIPLHSKVSVLRSFIFVFILNVLII